MRAEGSRLGFIKHWSDFVRIWVGDPKIQVGDPKIQVKDPQYKDQKSQTYFCQQIDFPASICRETGSGGLLRTFRV